MSDENTSHILIVDDNSVNRQVLTYILRDTYPLVEQVEDGEKCLQQLHDHPIDLVMLDLNMPNKSGFDVLEELQNNPPPHTPSIIVVSADNKPSTISRALRLGASDYVTTPFNRDELMARVKTHLTLRLREQDLEDRVASRTRELERANQELQQAQNQILQMEKMASLGQLAAGVAHEINNPIGYIKSNLGSLNDYTNDLINLIDAYQQAETHINDANTRDLLAQQHKHINLPFIKEDITQLISDSLNGARRVKQIVSDLKVFSHPEQKEWQQLDINDCVQAVLNIVSSEVKYKAEVELELADDLPEIQCSTTQIYQVITNLLVNASQAIEEHGTITITTARHPRRKNRLQIQIHDTGSGMPEETRKKIFDPFFTTKPVGEGTGLGLSVSYGIIESHGGLIDVESTEGKGTCFTIQLPIKQPKGIK